MMILMCLLARMRPVGGTIARSPPVDHENGTLGNDRLRRRDRKEERAGIREGRTFRTGRGHAPQRRVGGRLRAPTWRGALARRRRRDHRRTRHRRHLHRHADRQPLRLHIALRGGGKARVRRKANGHESRRMPRHDCRLPRGGGPAVGWLLPARAPTLSRRARPHRRRRHRRGAHGHVPPASAAARRRSICRGRGSMAGRSRVIGRRPILRGRCHTFDFLDFLFGPIGEVRAFAANQAGAYRPEDMVAATYRFASGVYGSGAWCYAADFDEEYNEIIGANGHIRFSTPPRCRFVSCAATRSRNCRRRSGARPSAADPDDRRRAQRDRQVSQHRRVGARTARVMDAILAEFRTQSAV